MFEVLLSPTAWLGAFGIFVLRVISIAMDTLRFMLVIRGKKTLAWVLGFIESVIFVFIMGIVVNDLNNILNIIGYAAGFATGSVVGIAIENRIAIGFSSLNIISRQRGQVVAESLRNANYAVTEIPARGKDGSVSLLTCSIRRKELKEVKKLILKADPEAFITVEDINPIQRGYWHT